jgi:hypothetical protein
VGTEQNCDIMGLSSGPSAVVYFIPLTAHARLALIIESSYASHVFVGAMTSVVHL